MLPEESADASLPKALLLARHVCCAAVLGGTAPTAPRRLLPGSTSTNPFETPALRRQREEESGAAAFAVAATAVPTLTQAAVPGGSSGGAAAGASAAAAAKAAQKQELLQAVREEEYEAEELDPEWGHLLEDLDSRLQVGHVLNPSKLVLPGGPTDARGLRRRWQQLAGYPGARCVECVEGGTGLRD